MQRNSFASRHARALLLNLPATACLFAGCGCGQQIELVPPGQVVRLAEDTPAKVATYSGRDAAGNAIWTVGVNWVTLPAGYFVAPPPPAPAPASQPAATQPSQ